ncbi:MAG TPA: ATP-binding protein [Solirubrobacteraceae bacterium]|nr:ATP-binding protein [Solirubrobacteraceae bacterium]
MNPLLEAQTASPPTRRRARPARKPLPAAAAPRRPRSRLASRAIVLFALAGLVALVLVGLGAVLVFQHHGEQEAARDARQLTRAIGLGMVAPRLSEGLVRGDDAAIGDLHAFVTHRVLPLDPAIERIKIWTRDGRIVYSDEPRLVGMRYGLAPDELRAFGSRRVNAEIGDIRGPENRFERGKGKLLEVYLPLTTRSGEQVMFELYLRYSAVAADAREIWTDFAPALLGALMLLWLVQLPLAWSLACRLRRGQREREALLIKAMQASESERRRIAGNLHDGVVQDLAGLSLTLAAAAERTHDPELVPVLSGAASSTRQSIRQMRSLLVDIYPANLHSAGLQPALGDLLAPLAARGLSTHAAIDPGLAAAPEVEQLVFRTAQEALRNVLRHADASAVDLHATVSDGTLSLVVADDGRGFAPDAVRRARAAGHFGLALLEDRASGVGGRLTIDTRPGHGTRVALEVPTA